MKTKNFITLIILVLCLLIQQSIVFAEPATDMVFSGTFADGYTVNPWYSSGISVTGGVTNYTFNITSGSLPSGFYIRQNGSNFYLEGIPNKAGTYTFKLKVSDRRDAYIEKEFSMKIISASEVASDMIIANSFNSPGTTGTWYSSGISVTGGVTNYTFSITSGSLPQGLYIRQNGSNFYLEGLPIKAGEHTFKLKITDRYNAYKEKEFSVNINGTMENPTLADDMTITGDFTTGQKINTQYSSSISVNGGESSRLISVVSGSLPPGLSLSKSEYSYNNYATIYLEGIPNTAGTYNFTLRVTDNRNLYIERPFTVTINAEPKLADDMTITGDFTTGQKINTQYSSSISVNGGWNSRLISVVSGSLPPGLSLSKSEYSYNNYATIYLEGIPNTAGTYNFTLRATDNRNLYIERPFTVTINAEPKLADDMTITGDFTTGQKINTQYSSSISVNGGWNSRLISVVSGSLPPGLSLSKSEYSYNNYATIYLEGIPNTAGTYNFTLRATDNRNLYIERPFTVTINAEPKLADDMTITDNFASGQKINTQYSSSVSVNGGWSLRLISVVSGSLPPGLSLSKSEYSYNNYATIYLEGIPNTAGTYNFTLRATDNRNLYVEKKFTVLIEGTSENNSELADDMLFNGTFADDYTVNPWYSSGIRIDGGTANYTFNITNGSLPPGFYIRQDGGYFYLEGIPNTPGTYTFKLKVTDSRNKYREKEFTVKIDDTHYVASDMLFNGTFAEGYTVNPWYSSGIRIDGGTANYTFNITGGSLPPGFYIRQDGGYFYLEGIPNTPGTYTFKLKVTDRRNAYREKEFSVVINGSNNAEKVQIITTSLKDATVGVEYNEIVEANLPELTWILRPWIDVPRWLTYHTNSDGSALILTGTPDNPGSYTFTIDVGNIYSDYQREFTITIKENENNSLEHQIITTSLPDGTIGVEYSADIKTNISEATWVIKTRPTGIQHGLIHLPEGLDWDYASKGDKSTIIIYGTPMYAGTYTINVNVSDGVTDFYETFTLKIKENENNSLIAINSINFPDEIFRRYVADNFDKNSDGYLSDSEIANAKVIYLHNKGVSNLKGIEFFTELVTLSCNFNNLTTLDLSKNLKLEFIYCRSNNLAELILGNNTALTDLDCRDNSSLTKLDIKGCPNLSGNHIYRDSGLELITDNGTSTPEVGDDEFIPEFKTHQPILEGQILVNFYVDMPEADSGCYDDSYVDFKVLNDTTYNEPQDFDPDFMNASRTYYGFQCALTSIQMADTIIATLHYGNNNTLTVSHSWTLKEYLDKFYNNEASPEKLKNLLAAMKDYGHYAQIALSETNGWNLGVDHIAMDYVNEYTTNDLNETKNVVSNYRIVRDTGTSDIQNVTFNLELDSDTTLNVYLRPKADYTGNVTAFARGVVGISNQGLNLAEKQSDGRYKIVINGIAAHQLAETNTIMVVTDNGTFYVKVSALSYADMIFTSSNAILSSINMKNAVTSLYKYYKATMEYREFMGQ